MNLTAMQRELAIHQEFIDFLKTAIDWHGQRVADLTVAIQEAERERLVMTPDGPVVAPELPADKEQLIHRDDLLTRWRDGGEASSSKPGPATSTAAERGVEH